MKVYIEILRPTNAIMAVIAVILMAIINKTYNLDVLIGCIGVFLATGAGNVINDYYDYEIDKINKPQRPIPSDRITRKSALYYSIILFLVAIILGCIISFDVGVMVIICTILMILYAYNFKRQVLFGNIIVSLLTALTFVYGGMIVYDVKIGSILGIFAFLMNMSREIIKDTEDVEGDLKEGAKTFPIVYGREKAVILAVVLNILTCILSPLLYTPWHIFNESYLIIVAIADIIFIYSAYMATQSYSKENLHTVSKYMKIGMCIAFVSFAIGSII